MGFDVLPRALRAALGALVLCAGCQSDRKPPPPALSPTLDIAPELAWRYLSWWEWATGKDARPVALTMFCDWIFERSDGSIHHVSILDGSVERIADSRQQLAEALKTIEARDRYVWETLTARAQRAGKVLQPGECYSFVVPPAIGGSFEEANVRPFAIGGYQLVMVQLTQLARRVPVGTEFSRLRMDIGAGAKVNLFLDGAPVQ